MKKPVFQLIICVLCLTFLSCGSTKNDKDDLLIKIAPSSQIVGIGEEISYQVKVENVEDLFAIALEIVFNGNLVELPDGPLTVGTAWGSEVIAVSFNEIDRLNVAIGLMQADNVVTLKGDKTLFEFVIRGKTAGMSQIFIHNLTMIDREGEMIDDFDEIEIENSSVTVQ